MKWYIKWRDMWCNAWNVWCSWNAKCATCVTCVWCVWCVQWHVCIMTWNDAKCDMKWREMMHEMTCNACNADRWFRLHATRCNLDFWSLIFDCDHNLIILFLILLRIWSIGVDVKLTQQDVKNLRLQIAPPYHPFCKGAKWNEWEWRAKMKWNE